MFPGVGQRLWTGSSLLRDFGIEHHGGPVRLRSARRLNARDEQPRDVPRHVWSAVARHSFGLRRSCFFVADAPNAECRLTALKSEAASSGRIPNFSAMSMLGRPAGVDQSVRP